MPQKSLVKATTPLGYEVVLTRNRWREIIRFKHPAAASHVDKLKQCLKNPDVIRASAKDRDVHVYYLKLSREFLCIVVAPQNGDRYFVVTVYLTKRIKQGDELWTK